MIYALKVNSKNAERVYNSLLEGEGRFGWSYIESADLNLLKEKEKNEGYNSLTDDEKSCYQYFLLDLKKDNYVVYINTPTYGKCTLAKVEDGYYWDFADDDFNHRFKVDKSSVKTFDRNSESVHPLIKSRLKLQGRYWRIRFKDEFEQLVNILENGYSDKENTTKSNVLFLNNDIQPFLKEITRKIHKTHPNYDLERLMKSIFENVDGVSNVEWIGGAADHGADLIVTYKSGLPIAGLETDERLIVQVKSFEGVHSDLQAIKDIKRAYEHFPKISMGLIVSTADEISKEFTEALTSLQEEINIPVSVLYGSDLGLFILQNGGLDL
ncbi:restriction endonuclease [Moraxella atlantae]|uniref:Restriction endonuclease type IV Mrr domain-containing protein n=1 Tax=Faucicola atlantae TaxID=34059 RepID=A0A378Q0J6_9GAMM|nr:restriction endonuclease [Moraxella atlantae]STY94340.1 Uncharacterised protein [Moraxella atlantae]